MSEPDRMTLAEVRRLNRGDPQPNEHEHRAVALIAEGRVDVVTKTKREVLVEVAGRTEGRHRVRADALGWHCDCTAFHHRRSCAHVTAARLIVAGPGLRRLPPADNATAGELFDQGNAR